MCVCKQGVCGRCRTGVGRRQVLSVLGLLFVGCGGGEGDGAKPGGSGGNGPGPSATCHEIPEEEAGEHPDTRGIISQDAFYRSDITEGKGGVPLILQFTLLYADGDCLPIAGANVE